MGQEGIPISIAIVIATVILGAVLLIGMLLLAVLPALIG
jgi:hypothetical protein